MAGKVHSPVVDGFEAWFAAFTQPTVLVELGVLGGCVGLAWALVALLRKGSSSTSSILFGRSVIDGALFPLVLLGLGYVARALLQQWVPLAVWVVAIPVLMALVAIRIGVKVLQVAFPQAPWVRPM
ncbi:MAG TPA: mechanosensitive ion channel protein, partial [Giesbergeria sp.]|nr:mechanosensitive ion channel protein [Giesbergeria sp.]